MLADDADIKSVDDTVDTNQTVLKRIKPHRRPWSTPMTR